ncbi:MAG: hypothetical protein U0169_01365 [Polyangiaceae bacterium]
MLRGGRATAYLGPDGFGGKFELATERIGQRVAALTEGVAEGASDGGEATLRVTYADAFDDLVCVESGLSDALDPFERFSSFSYGQEPVQLGPSFEQCAEMSALPCRGPRLDDFPHDRDFGLGESLIGESAPQIAVSRSTSEELIERSRELHP